MCSEAVSTAALVGLTWIGRWLSKRNYLDESDSILLYREEGSLAIPGLPRDID